MTLTDESFAISQVAEKTGLSTHTLRYYEREGLMLPVDRASSTHRRYSTRDLTWLMFLTKLRSTGMPIATVREYARLVHQGEDTSQARLDLLLTHRITVIAQLEDIQRSLAAIDFKIENYSQIVGLRS